MMAAWRSSGRSGALAERVIDIAVVSAVLLRAAWLRGFAPFWDGMIYLQCLERAPVTNQFECAAHPTQSFVGLTLLMSKFVPGDMYHAHLVLTALVSILAYIRLGPVVTELLRVPTPAAKLLLASAVLSPVWSAAIANPNPDFLLAALAALTFSELQRGNYCTAVLLGVGVAFCKELGVLVYAAIAAAHLFLWANAKVRRTSQMVRLSLGLALPVVAFATYLSLRILVWHSPLWSTGGATRTEHGLLRLMLSWSDNRQVWSPLRDLYVLNYSWVPASLGLLAIGRRRAAMDHQYWGILLWNLLLCYVFTRFPTFNNVRYYSAGVLPVLLFCGAGLRRLDVRRQTWFWLAFAVLQLRSNFVSDDPASIRIFGVGQTMPGFYQMAAPSDEFPLGYGRDQLVYNLQFVQFDRAYTEALTIAEREHRMPIHSNSFEWYFSAREDAHSHRRCRNGCETPRVVTSSKSARGRIAYLLWPNVENPDLQTFNSTCTRQGSTRLRSLPMSVVYYSCPAR